MNAMNINSYYSKCSLQREENMKASKPLIGICFGAITGIIDVIPMLFQGLSWDANFSAFALWVVSGFLISTSSLKLNSAIKGVLISVLVLIPVAILIGWQNPITLIPIAVMTLILGSLLGYSINRFTKNEVP
jgi:CHASE2 domain-containing sensor protein